MDAELRATLLDLARYIDHERKQLEDGIRLYMGDGLTADQRADLNALIKQRGQLRHQRAGEIEEAASRVPKDVAVILFKAARLCRGGDTEATPLLEEAAAELQTGERTPPDAKAVRLPVVRLNPPEVEYKGKVFQVEPDHALAFQALVEQHPERVGLTRIIGAHPERKMAKLPSELQGIVDTTGKGSRLVLS